MSTEDLPYRAEYAKSGRASCRGCKSTIEKDVLRLAVMIQVPHILQPYLHNFLTKYGFCSLLRHLRPK